MTQAIASPIVHDLIGIGFGPSNLALAIAAFVRKRRTWRVLTACFGQIIL